MGSTGLDPALPLFMSSNLDKKLDKTDALFVDVLHTDALVEGKAERCGHIDFYMNGGLEQPGCWNGKIIGTLSSDKIEKQKHQSGSLFFNSFSFFLRKNLSGVIIIEHLVIMPNQSRLKLASGDGHAKVFSTI